MERSAASKLFALLSLTAGAVAAYLMYRRGNLLFPSQRTPCSTRSGHLSQSRRPRPQATMPEFLLHRVAKLKENEKKLVSAGTKKVLVLRHQGKLSVFQSKCPHAGGPLEKGAICNGRLICPWHMGTFRISDGRLIEPPAMDSLETYPLRIEDSKVFVALPPPKAAVQRKEILPPRSDNRRMVIVGVVQRVLWLQRHFGAKDFAAKSL